MLYLPEVCAIAGVVGLCAWKWRWFCEPIESDVADADEQWVKEVVALLMAAEDAPDVRRDLLPFPVEGGPN